MEDVYIHTKNTNKKMMKNILISLIPLILFAIYKNSIVLLFNKDISTKTALYPIFLLIICSLSTFIFEILYALIFYRNKTDIKKYIKNSYAFLPGIILGLIIPINTPIIIIVLSCFIGTILGRMIFGGYSQGLINTVSLTVMIILIFSLLNGGYSYLNTIEKTKYDMSPINIVESNTVNITYKEAVEPYGGLKQFFVGNVPGGIGEVSIVFCVLAFIYLIVKKSIKYLIPISILITTTLLFSMVAILNNQGIWFVIYNLFTGGIVFASIFSASESMTSPLTNTGQIIYGIIIGILTTLFRFFIPFGGIFLSIIIANVMVPVIDNIVIINTK
ncbi:MAG: RnfABCDGE type electron transport complex subunit D [Clostridium sp.]|nr:RnfABCDGE type electron transport complex subunit D [Clostridium sp.]MCM1444242.1 RnfABCDGE type electron transport complex subunit D [Candidatus Amulumruptor caecigallinarius]